MNKEQQNIYGIFNSLPQEQQWKVLEVLAASDQEMLGRTVLHAQEEARSKDGVASRSESSHTLELGRDYKIEVREAGTLNDLELYITSTDDAVLIGAKGYGRVDDGDTLAVFGLQENRLYVGCFTDNGEEDATLEVFFDGAKR